MFGKKGSKIPKLPPVRNCFTLAMTNKLVVIINSLKVPKIKKILLYEMKFLVPNYSCLQNPRLGGCRPQIPVLSVLCPQLNLLTPPPEQNSRVPQWVHRTFIWNTSITGYEHLTVRLSPTKLATKVKVVLVSNHQYMSRLSRPRWVDHSTDVKWIKFGRKQRKKGELNACPPIVELTCAILRWLGIDRIVLRPVCK